MPNMSLLQDEIIGMESINVSNKTRSSTARIRHVKISRHNLRYCDMMNQYCYSHTSRQNNYPNNTH
jgi:hypothetical protein